MTVATLDLLAAGDLSPRAAWGVVRPLLAETPSDQMVARVYFALRSWTWKTIDRRRRDEKLRQWIDVMNRAEAFIVDRFAHVAAKIEALVELLYESLAVADTTRVADPMRRKHAREIAALLRAHGDEWTPRAALIDRCGLKPANLTRLMNILADARMIEVEERGREIAYRLSRDGIAATTPVERPLPSDVEAIMRSTLKRLRISDWASEDKAVEGKTAGRITGHYTPSFFTDSTAILPTATAVVDPDWVKIATGPARTVSIEPRPSDMRVLLAGVGGN